MERLRHPAVALCMTAFFYMPFYLMTRYLPLFNRVDSILARGSIFHFVARRAALDHVDQDNVVLVVASAPAFPLLFLTAWCWSRKGCDRREYSLSDLLITFALCAWLVWVSSGMVLPGLSASRQFVPLPLLFLNEFVVLTVAACALAGSRQTRDS